MWLVGFRYIFGKNCIWGLCTSKNMYKISGCGCFLKMFFTWKYIKINFFYFLKLILTSMNQNDLKIKKN